jgi:ribonuclease R
MRGRGRSGDRGQRRPLIEGKIQHKGTFAFLLSEVPGQQDIYLSGPTVHLAMDGDRVEARQTGEKGGRRYGEIVRVVTRARATAVGILKKVGRFWALFPEGSPTEGGLEVLGFAKGVEPRAGALASLKIERWPTEHRGPGGTITEILGNPEEPAARRKALLAVRDIPTVFPEDALEEAASLPLDPAEADWQGRSILFDLPIFTIDGADAKDFDDAVSLEAQPGGRWRLGVHIASVADYVKRNTPLDNEAVKRGTSRVDLEETVIRSCRRFTYEEVQEVLDGKTVERVSPQVKESVLNMGALAKRMTALRMSRGGLDMMVPEYEIKTDSEGNPLAVSRRPRLDSHRLIEEFMVAANEAVARTLSHARAPFLRRIHEDPDPEKLQTLQDELGKLGIKAPTSLVAHPVQGLQGLLKAAIGHPFEETANIQVIRSLKMARYSSMPGGHFGLASKDYCHFTSPIRRYPDLVVHRAVKGLLRGKPRDHAEGIDMEALAIRCSERERVAQDAERKAVDLARASLMGREIGRVFDAVAVNCTNAGVFLVLPESGASGLWRGGTATLGAAMKMRLTAVDQVLGRLEFENVNVKSALMPNQVRKSPWRNRRRR